MLPLVFLKYLYWKLVPAGRLMVPVQRWLLLVYWEAESAIAELVSQLPSWEIEPTT